MSTSEAPFDLEETQQARQQLWTLASTAAARGVLREYVAAVTDAVQQLRTRPLEWGDPDYRTRKQGGYVCHGLSGPLIVTYVVFEAERYVCILRVRALPSSPLM